MRIFILGCIDDKVGRLQRKRGITNLNYCGLSESADGMCPFLSSTYRCTKFDKMLGEIIPTKQIYAGGCYKHGT